MADQLIRDAVAGLLDRHWDPAAPGEDGGRPMATAVWDALAAAGFPWVSVPESAGGSGGTPADAAAILREVGRRAVPVPLAETGVLGGWLLARAGLVVPPRPVTVAAFGPSVVGHDARLAGGPGRWRLTARLHRVPWTRESAQVVGIASYDGSPHVVAVPVEDVEVVDGRNLAGEPRDLVVVDGIRLPDEVVGPVPPGTGEELALRGALTRTAMIAGALERVAELTTGYANDRVQFGRPIIAFQAVASHVVRITEEVEGAVLAARLAVAAHGAADGVDAIPGGAFETAASKVCAGMAAGVVARLAHQVHGAIGMTDEYELGRLTRRLWCWRQEFGSARVWSRWLGERAVERGAGELWPLLTGARP